VRPVRRVAELGSLGRFTRMLLPRLLVFALVLACGCGVNRNEVDGVYTTKYSHGSEVLTLATNGRFTQVFTSTGQQPPITNSGTWEFWRDRRSVLLRDAITFDGWTQQQTQSLEKTVWLIRVAKRFGKISLIWGEEGVEEYDKQK